MNDRSLALAAFLNFGRRLAAEMAVAVFVET